MTSISTASKDYSRRLLRALLREASYLPDHVARLHFHRQISARFRSYSPRAGSVAKEPTYPPTLVERVPRLHALGRHTLHLIQRANAGFRPDILKVLLVAYGRTGKRRHALLEPLKRKDDIRSTTLMPGLEKRPNLPPGLLDALPYPNAMFEALLKSQVKQALPELTGPRLKRAKLDVPEKNVWQRPLPVNRLSNLIRGWYAELLDKVLPPLPDAEWDELHDLATGEKKWSGIPERRTSCGESISLAKAERDLKLALVRARGGREKPHNLTLRYMQRVYGIVLQVCPRMDWSAEKQTWSVKWHSTGKRQASRTWKANGQLYKASEARPSELMTKELALPVIEKSKR